MTRLSKTVESTTVSFASVVLERLSGMIVLPLLVVTGFALEPSLVHVDHAWVALLVAGVTLATLGLILFAAGHPGLGGRFASKPNWTRFIGAVFLGVDRARHEPLQMLRVLGTALVYQLSIVALVSLGLPGARLPRARSPRRLRSYPQCRCSR